MKCVYCRATFDKTNERDRAYHRSSVCAGFMDDEANDCEWCSGTGIAPSGPTNHCCWQCRGTGTSKKEEYYD